MSIKSMTVRLDEDRAQMLQIIAEANNTSQNEVLLAGLDAVAEKYRQDDAFKARVSNAIERHQRVLDRLA